MKKNQGHAMAGNRDRRPTAILLMALAALLTFFAFYPSLKNGFINWDDNFYVFENLHLRKPLPEAVRYFFGPHYFVGNYIPLTMITYALEFHFAGLNPQFFHSVNLFLHLANVMLVFWFIYLLSEKKVMVAAIVALFFGIHPMHVESVAWIAELKDVLYTFFFTAGLIAYLQFIKKEQWVSKNLLAAFPLWAFVLFVLSVLSKPAAVIFPVVLLLLDFYLRRANGRRIWFEKLPFFIVSVIFGFIAIYAQQADRLLQSDHSIINRILFASYALLAYLVKFFMPLNLSIFHPLPDYHNGPLPNVYYFAPLVVILLFYGVYRTLPRTRLVAFGFLFFFVNLVLVLQLVSFGEAIMAERYTYVPYTGLLFIGGMAFQKLLQNKNPKLEMYRPWILISVTVLAATCIYLTRERCKVWKNDDTIGTDLLKKYPGDRLALNNKGFILYEQRRYAEAAELFTKAVAIKPDYMRAHINLINTYLAMNDPLNAARTADTALKYDPEDHHLLNARGYLYFQEQRHEKAVQFYKEAIRVQANNINAYINLAECYYTMQEHDKALEIVEQGLLRDPSNYILLNNKGYILFVRGQYEAAAEYFKASLREKPDYSTASANLSNCYQAMRDSGSVPVK